MEGLDPPRLLRADDESAQFDCGVAVLNEWLKRRALVNHLSGASRTYVVTARKRIVGFYCLAAGSVDHAMVPGKVRRNMPEPIPVIALGRLAVDATFQGRGIGPALLQHAIERTHESAQIVGIRALLVHAKDEAAAGFYKHFGYIASPLDDLVLMARI